MFFENDLSAEMQSRIKENNNHHCFLVTGQIKNFEQLNKNAFIILTIKWKKKVKDLIHTEDLGVVLNSGNLLVFIEDERVEKFKKEVLQISVEKSNIAVMNADILELNEHEKKAIISR